MGSILDWAADQEKERWEREFGKAEREAQRKYEELCKMGSRNFTVNELKFLLDPHGKYNHTFADVPYKLERLTKIYDRVNANRNSC
jgi:hypothetical protein